MLQIETGPDVNGGLVDTHSFLRRGFYAQSYNMVRMESGYETNILVKIILNL